MTLKRGYYTSDLALLEMFCFLGLKSVLLEGVLFIPQTWHFWKCSVFYFFHCFFSHPMIFSMPEVRTGIGVKIIHISSSV